MFNILLDFCLRLVDMSGVGLELPADLEGMTFRVVRAGFANDIALIGRDEYRLSEAFDGIQEVCSAIRLDIFSKKTEWLYLHHLSADQLAECKRWRQEGTGACCGRIRLRGQPLKYVRVFTYLGSMVDEAGGMGTDMRKRVAKAYVDFGKYSRAWAARMRMGTKVQCLQAKVLRGLQPHCPRDGQTGCLPQVLLAAAQLWSRVVDEISQLRNIYFVFHE
jgi:hypothetical protein